MNILQEVEQVEASAQQLYSAAQVEEAARDLAGQIANHTQGRELLVLCVMNGGLVATALLLPHLPNPVRLDYIHATRYRDQIQGNSLRWQAEPSTELAGKTVLVVDDIFDEGYTLKTICAYCSQQGAREVCAAVLVNKLHDRKVESFTPNFMGLDVPDLYVFGSGMDYKGYLRNMPGIYALPVNAAT